MSSTWEFYIVYVDGDKGKRDQLEVFECPPGMSWTLRDKVCAYKTAFFTYEVASAQARRLAKDNDKEYVGGPKTDFLDFAPPPPPPPPAPIPALQSYTPPPPIPPLTSIAAPRPDFQVG